jgi:hypothetical protein
MPFFAMNQDAMRLLGQSLSAAGPASLWWTTGIKAWQTMLAAPEVIARRTSRMAAAGPFPKPADWRELATMGSEKAVAFSQACLGAAREAAVFQQQLATLALGQWWTAASTFNPIMMFRPLTCFPPSQNFTNASLRLAQGLAIASLLSTQKLAASALPRVLHSAVSPVHAKATRNAKRLRRKA